MKRTRACWFWQWALATCAAPSAQSFPLGSTYHQASSPVGDRHSKASVGLGASTSDYLSSLSSASTGGSAEPEQSAMSAALCDANDTKNGDIPEGHYSKRHPNAGWRGYANPQFGGYLDALPTNAWEAGKQSDYGDDVRWGAEVYLNSMERDHGGSDEQTSEPPVAFDGMSCQAFKLDQLKVGEQARRIAEYQASKTAHGRSTGANTGG